MHDIKEVGLGKKPIFSNTQELIQWARTEVQDRVGTLEKDVRHCLLGCSQYAPAPFPALLFCFSTIDLLGALYAGRASKGSSTTQQSKKYMWKFIQYKREQSDLLIELFRHKLVHLAQPKPVINFHNQYITWREHHKNSKMHLKKVKLVPTVKVLVTSRLSIECEYEFHISILDLVEDIKNSVVNSKGYLAVLQRNPKLQCKFERAISQIYDYT